MSAQHRIDIGVVDVDSGLLMVGDPCYTLPEGASRRTANLTDWARFCDHLSTTTQQASEPAGAGALLVLRTPEGDGTYPVYIECDETGAPHRLVVDLAPWSTAHEEDGDFLCDCEDYEPQPACCGCHCCPQCCECTL